jgi:membrane-bound lytic murein transglycosylase B
VAHGLSLAAATVVAQVESTRPSFSEFLAGVRSEALARGIRPDILDAALSNIEEPLPIVIERDRAQAETVFSLEKYVSRLLTVKLMKRGREALASHRMLLEQVGARYGVPPEIVVAIWGIESNFGSFSGVRPTVAALATLAWDPRRSAFFRGELFAALEILNRGDIDAARMRGSWAGAMGQVQFMPSTYLKFAEDFDGDGRRDIWSSPPDVLASIANYLHGHGWTAGQSWGREVHASKEWEALGVRLPNGGALSAADPDASLVSGATRHFLVYRNYDALLEYNCSHSYAISVGLLANQIGTTSAPASGARPRKPASRRPPARNRSRP